jgi:hypothetical protein
MSVFTAPHFIASSVIIPYRQILRHKNIHNSSHPFQDFQLIFTILGEGNASDSAKQRLSIVEASR